MSNTTEKKEAWKFSDNIHFEYEKMHFDNHTPWSGHKYFAYDLVCNMKPELIVELGTWKGTSLCAFSQAIKDTNNKSCRVVGIDTWEGDLNTGQYNGDLILNTLEKTIDNYYSEVKTQLIRKYFNDAVIEFDDNSIDILHIDGLHTYDAVKEDYTVWKSKLKENGVILFHDIYIEKENFGVKQFWNEAKSKFKTSISFPHSCGLGVLFLKTPIFTFTNEDSFHLHYLKLAYENTKHSLYNAEIKTRELGEIKSSKYWRIKENIKRYIFLKKN